MSENAATAGPSTSEAVEELLRQLVDARFVLTDRDGAVTRWSRPAEELFGWPGARILGRPLVETLGLGNRLPESGGRVTTAARRKDGQELEVALTFVPVRMSQSLEFNGFLEALEIAAPRGDALAQLQRSHRTVVEWISAAIAGHAELDDDGLAAGTIVAFRPLKEPPPPAPEEPEDPPGAATAAAAGQIADAVEAALGRSEDIERLLEGATAELAEAQARLDRLEEMRAQVEGLRSELERTRTAGEEQAREDRERARRDAEEGEAERERVRRRLDEVWSAVAAQERLEAQLEQMREQVGALEAAVSDEQGLAGWVDEVHARMAALESALENAHDREAAERAAHALREELTETRRLVEVLRTRIEEVQVEAGGDDEVENGDSAQLRTLAEEVREAAAAARQAQSATEALTGRAEEATARLETRADRLESQVSAVEDRTSRIDERLEAVEHRVQDSGTQVAEVARRAETAAGLAEEQATRAVQSAAAADERAGHAEAASAAAQGSAAAANEHADRAQESSGAAEQHANRADEAAGTAAGRADRAQESSGAAEQHAHRAEESSGAAEQHADRARDESGSAEHNAARADEAAASAERHAGRAGEQTGQVEGIARRLADAAEAAERRATQAEQAAAAAADAAALARQSAEEASVEAQAVGRAVEEGRASRPYEAAAVLAPYRSQSGDSSAPAPGSAADADPHRPLFGKKRDSGPARDRRPGFDDATEPMATIELDGRFRELNQAFTDLVGYSEDDFKSASWPPVMDRANLDKHREQMKRLLAGEIDSAEVNTGYVHAQGLLVPVVGTISLVEAGDEPDHFLLAAKS